MNLSHDPAQTHHRTVLIVEDGSRFRDMLTRALREMNYAPKPVADAEAAIQSLTQESAAIALVDLGLPGMSGLELCQYLHEHHPDIQIVILTGFGDLEAAKQAIRLDVVDFLTKPCEHSELEIALDRAYRRSIARHKEQTESINTDGTTEQTNQTDQSAHSIKTIEELERKHILDAIERHNGNRTKAAKELGISVRTLYYRLSRYKTLDRIEAKNKS